MKRLYSEIVINILLLEEQDVITLSKGEGYEDDIFAGN